MGEGFTRAAPPYFLRFAGCNLGPDARRIADAVCKFCDTDFVGIGPDGGRFRDGGTTSLMRSASRWPMEREGGSRLFVVCNGRRTLLQLDTERSTRCTRADLQWRSRPTERSRRRGGSIGFA